MCVFVYFHRLFLGIPILCSYKAASVPVWQGQLCATAWQHFCIRLHVIPN